MIVFFLCFQWIEPTADAGVNQYTFHIEPVSDVSEVCRKVREAGMRVRFPITGIFFFIIFSLGWISVKTEYTSVGGRGVYRTSRFGANHDS